MSGRTRTVDNSNSFGESLTMLSKFLKSTELEKQCVEDLLQGIPDIEDTHIPYAAITRVVFSLANPQPEKVQELQYFRDKYIEKIKSSPNAVHKRANINKFVEHVELAVMQKSSLYEEHKTKIDYLNQQIEKIQGSITEFNKAKKEIDKIREEYNNMTRDFVGIMGISSAIVFAVFGGLQQIGSIGQNLYNTPLHKILIFSGVSALILTFVVFMAFNAIARMTGLNLSSCNCAEGECSKRNPIHKHPTLFAMVWIFSTMIASGVLILIFKKYIDVWGWVKWGVVSIVIFSICWTGKILYDEFFCKSEIKE